MRKSPLNYRTAFFLALGITLLMNMFMFIIFIFGKDAVAPAEAPKAALRMSDLLRHVLTNFMFLFPLYAFNFELLKKKYPSNRKWLLIISGALILTVILSALFSWVHILMSNDTRPTTMVFIGGFFRDMILSVVVTLSSQLIYLSDKQQKTALENKTLLAENMRSRYAVLKNQVDPHFLFNSLNTLNALIKMDAEKAQEYVQQLSFVFRYTLQNKETITVSEELKFAQAYYHLMQIRYGECLQIVQQINDK